MSNREAIRALIPNADAAMKVGEIIDLLPTIKPQIIREAVGQMYRDAVLDRTGNKSDGFAYFVCRAVKLKRYATPEERAAGKRKTDADHNRRRHAQTREELRAGWAVTREQRKLEREAAKAARMRDVAERRQSERKAQEDATAAKRTARAVKRIQRLRTPAQRLLSNSPARATLPHITEAPKPVRRVESVEEWIAKGNKPQVLPIGAVSQPLKFAGHKGMAKESWERSGRKAA